jgi:hypothetical protein
MKIHMIRVSHLIPLSLSLCLLTGAASAQIAGSTTIGVVDSNKIQLVALGWSARRQIIGQVVVNEDGEKVGRIDDLIIAPDTAASFAIVGAGGFIGVKRHDVLIPVEQFALRDGHLVLVGASKAAIKALPKFEYAVH